MAFDQADVDRIKDAIASAERQIRHSDGRTIIRPPVAELKLALALIEGAVNPPTTPRLRRIITRGRY